MDEHLLDYVYGVDDFGNAYSGVIFAIETGVEYPHVAVACPLPKPREPFEEADISENCDCVDGWIRCVSWVWLSLDATIKYPGAQCVATNR